MALGVADLGLSFSREFTIFEKKIAIGITPKLQRVVTFHYAADADYEGDFDENDLDDASETYQHINLDVGASFRFGETNKWIVGVVGKNLISKEFEFKDAEVRGATVPTTVSVEAAKLEPQYRAGIAFSGGR